MTGSKVLSAADLAGMLAEPQLLNVATVTAGGAPRVAPVNGLFYRGRFWFGSAPGAVRFSHLRVRPQVSATVTRPDLAVIVHGTARLVDLSDPRWTSFRDFCVEVYGPRWLEGGSASQYATIEPAQLYALAFESK